MTATTTGRDSTVPTRTRRDRSFISARRASDSSVSVDVEPGWSRSTSRYPPSATASWISSVLVTFGSKSTVARSEAKLASTRSTPGNRSTMDSMLTTQVAQETPSPAIRNSARWVSIVRLCSGPTPTASANAWSPFALLSTAAWSKASDCSAVASCSADSTTMVPCTMFIPHVNVNSPALSGVNSRVALPYAGRDFETPKSEKTMRDVQSPASWRSNTRRSGTPSRTRITSGEYPPLTVISISWTPARISAVRARLGPKKNHNRNPARRAPAAITAIWSMSITDLLSPPRAPGWTLAAQRSLARCRSDARPMSEGPRLRRCPRYGD